MTNGNWAENPRASFPFDYCDFASDREPIQVFFLFAVARAIKERNIDENYLPPN